MHPRATHSLPGTNKPLLEYSTSNNSLLLLWMSEKTGIMKRVWDKWTREKTSWMLQNAFQHFTRQSWESMALFQQVLDVKGEYGGGGSCWEKAQLNRPRSHCTRKVYLTYRMNLLPFLTVLATFVSRALLNLPSLFLAFSQLANCLASLSRLCLLFQI